MTAPLRSALSRTLVLAALVVGCASSSSGRLDPLRRSVKAYNEAYRWKNYERAASFLPKELRLSFLDAYGEDGNDLHVEGYQILQVRLIDERAADVEVRITYMMLPSVVVQKRKVVQHWHKVGERWTLETEDNPIRELNAEAETEAPGDENAFGGGEPTRGNTTVKVTDPEGNVIRDDTGGARDASGQPQRAP